MVAASLLLSGMVQAADAKNSHKNKITIIKGNSAKYFHSARHGKLEAN